MVLGELLQHAALVSNGGMVTQKPSLAYLTTHSIFEGVKLRCFSLAVLCYSKETISRSSQGGYGGMSIRLARGVYYHFGDSKGREWTPQRCQEIDYGGMLLTTQNIYFAASAQRSEFHTTTL